MKSDNKSLSVVRDPLPRIIFAPLLETVRSRLENNARDERDCTIGDGIMTFVRFATVVA